MAYTGDNDAKHAYLLSLGQGLRTLRKWRGIPASSWLRS
jgi:hypothetical protein